MGISDYVANKKMSSLMEEIKSCVSCGAAGLASIGHWMEVDSGYTKIAVGLSATALVYGAAAAYGSYKDIVKKAPEMKKIVTESALASTLFASGMTNAVFFAIKNPSLDNPFLVTSICGAIAGYFYGRSTAAKSDTLIKSKLMDEKQKTM